MRSPAGSNNAGPGPHVAANWRLRLRRDPVVHRRGRVHRPAGPVQRGDRNVPGARRFRALRDHGDALERGLVRLAPAKLPRAGRPIDRRGPDVRSSRRRRTRARAAPGPTRPAGCGSATGTPAWSRGSTRPRHRGANGTCRAATTRPIRSTSTTVRVDPAAEAFESFPSDGPNAAVRQQARAPPCTGGARELAASPAPGGVYLDAVAPTWRRVGAAAAPRRRCRIRHGRPGPGTCGRSWWQSRPPARRAPRRAPGRSSSTPARTRSPRRASRRP